MTGLDPENLAMQAAAKLAAASDALEVLIAELQRLRQDKERESEHAGDKH